MCIYVCVCVYLCMCDVHVTNTWVDFCIIFLSVSTSEVGGSPECIPQLAKLRSLPPKSLILPGNLNQILIRQK